MCVCKKLCLSFAHHSLSAHRSLLTNSVGFTIGDSDSLDQLGVSIFADPVYGTPIFVTTGGYTRCPWEPGTNQRDGVRVTPVSSAEQAIVRTQDDVDKPIVLDLAAVKTSPRAEDASSGYYLRVTNDDDLVITYKEQLVLGQVCALRREGSERVAAGMENRGGSHNLLLRRRYFRATTSKWRRRIVA